MLLPLLLSVYKDENSVLKFGDLRAECVVSETMIIGSKDLVSDTKARYTRAGQDKSLHAHHLKSRAERLFFSGFLRSSIFCQNLQKITKSL